MSKAEGRIKQLFRQYGWVAVGVHLSVYATCMAGLYFAIEKGLDPHKMLEQYGLLSKKEVDDDGDEKKRGWFANLLAGPNSSLALAFICNKALLPIRVPTTVALTPMVARARLQAASGWVPEGACWKAESEGISENKADNKDSQSTKTKLGQDRQQKGGPALRLGTVLHFTTSLLLLHIWILQRRAANVVQSASAQQAAQSAATPLSRKPHTPASAVNRKTG